MRLSVLDQAPIAEGSTIGEALRNSIDLARVAEGCGYTRYWLAEHHGTPALGCGSPEVLMGPVAAATERIRVGSGGIMLPHYSPYKVAETFRMLSGLYPGRIDLGIGRAPGTTPNIARAMQRDRRQAAPDDFPEQLEELLALLAGDPGGPEPWLLGSSAQSGVWAAELGLPYVFADFINPGGIEVAARYREEFQASRYGERPRVGVAMWGICAESDEEAMRLSASLRMMGFLLQRGRSIAVPPPDKARQFLEDQGLPLDRMPPGRRILTGSPQSLRAQIEAVAHAYGAEEVLAVNILYDHAARRKSYELLAGAFNSGVPGPADKATAAAYRSQG